MLRFLAALLGPVFAKEMVEISRRRRYYFNRALYGSILLLVLWLVWLDYRWRLDSGGPAALAQMAEFLFGAVTGVQYAAVVLLVPVFLCGVIAGEREEHTLDLLFTTHLTDGEIVLGKLASRAVAILVVILGSVPVLSFIMLF